MSLTSINKSEPLCKVLDWDSAFFGFSVARLTSSHPAEDELLAATQWCHQQGIRCLYWQVAADFKDTVNLASKFGFHYADTRLELVASLALAESSHSTDARPLAEKDLTAVIDLAQSAFTHSRFIRDPNFGLERGHALFATWVERDIHRENGSFLVIPDAHNSVAGFISCYLDEGGAGIISLAAVHPDSRGVGIGNLLLQSAMNFFQRQGALKVFVVTQGANIAAQRLYIRNHFLPTAVSHWYHRWF